MFKFIKNKFLFILLISIATLVVLIIGALTLYKDNSLVFANDGYIIETSTKTNTKYYFTANTKYKENVEEKITFSDKDNNKVSVDSASFVHYNNGNVSFLQKGALVNLADITSPMVSYYNITNENTIIYDKDHYTVTSNDKKINIESFVGRISDNKYIIAGKDLTLKIPTEADRIAGDYFEILFIEEGIVKIDNQDHSYQVTAQDSYIYIGDNITINLGDGKIFYDGDAKMLLSQITINNDENINLDVEKENSSGGSGDGSGSGTGEGSGEDGDGTGTGEGEGDGDGTGEGIGEGDGTGESGNGTGTGTGESGDNTTASPQIELIEAVVTSTTIDLSLQLNNANLAKGNVIAYLTNVATGTKETPKRIDLTNGTFKLPYSALVPNTEYALTIVETGIENEKQYFQKTFKTKELGISLEKTYATDSSLAYNIIFDENTEVTKAHITIYDNNGTNDSISPNEFTISKDDLDNSAIFTSLKSNTSYSINVDTVWINNTAYSNLYTINRIDTTLKKTPTISGVKVDANAEEVKFTIELSNVVDKDSSIISYTYNIYLADDITLENENPTVQYSVTKNDSDPLVLNLNEIDELKTGVDYRCKIVAQYNDNDMIREVSTDYSSNFLIRSKPSISFELKNADMSSIEGTISLIDANCTVPIKGRSCSNLANNFTLRYYKLEEEETTENDTVISFDPKKLTSQLSLENLSSNTTYAVKVFGNYYDDDGILHPNVQLGDTFYVTTDKSPNIYFEIIGDNISGTNKDGTANSANVVTFDARLAAPQSTDLEDEIVEEISSITFNLYSGRYNTKEKLIGTYKITDKNSILDLFSNVTIKNNLFEDLTGYKVGKIDTLEKLIKVTNNSTGTLNSSYTVEVEGVYNSGEKMVIEDNVYTFNLTPSYYLDARIETNPKENYITVTPILKENLTEEEYETLSKTINNLDELNDQTVVGLTIENSLSDIFVDSAFTYEKAVVNYIICNKTTKGCDNIISELTDSDPDNDEAAKKKIKILSVDMGNKYQPKTQTIYLDSSELDDGDKYFTRGYEYKIGYTINFTTEDGSNPIYTNAKLYQILGIERQAPIYTQYISTSNSNGITYRYSFKDIDRALANKNFYYTLADDKENYQELKNTLKADGKQQDVTIPIDSNSTYTLYYARKNTKNETEYISMTTNDFETEYNYDNVNAYEISKNVTGNLLKIRLLDNDVTNRAIAYKVVISTKDQSNISDYTKYFLASKLGTETESTNTYDNEGNEIINEYKYITIDYSNISKFIGYEMKVSVYSYYDSGLVGYNQVLDNGFVLKNRETSKYLNIYDSGTNTTSTHEAITDNMGIYLLKEPYAKDDETIYIYNYLLNTNPKKYNSLIGATWNEAKDLSSDVGVKFESVATNAGMLLTTGKTEYLGYDIKVLKEAQLKTEDDSYQFNTIVPIITVTTNSKNTINSVNVSMTASGIYGNNQFIKDGVSHDKVYIEMYSDEECTTLIGKKEGNVYITGNDEDGYQASIESVEYQNLNPATKYYFKVYAWINNKYTQLYDSSSKDTYITKTYEISTLDKKGIISGITFSVEPTAYSGESSQKTLTWRLNLKSTDNYKIRFELYKPDGTTRTEQDENGEEITLPNFEPVKFDGSTAASCNTDTMGTSSTGYISNCYISVKSSEVSSINNKNQTYNFTGDDFIFGGNYYKLIVYAIPYTNGAYVEDQRVILYQNDSLTTTPIETIDGVQHNITIPELEEAYFTLYNGLSAGSNNTDGYYISFSPVVHDTHKVIKYGTYTITLKNEKGNIIDRKLNVDATKVYNNTEVEKFTGLSSNTLYYLELTYETYRNNIGFTEEEKQATIPFTDFIYTPISNDITLGTITASQSTAKGVTLTYNGSTNLSNKIVGVYYTISLKGGSSKTTGHYITYDNIGSDEKNTSNIFTVSSDKTPRLTIDTSNSSYSSNTGFTFKSGNTYIITTQYYFYNDDTKKVELLEDLITGNSTYTTILNL